MASIFKRSKRKNSIYSIQYYDHEGKRRTVKGFTDKGLSEQLASKLESDARLRTSGLVDAEQDRYAGMKLSPLAIHLAAFKESLTDNSPKHVAVTWKRINCIVAGCGFEKLADIHSEVVQTFLRTLRKTKNISHRTYNHYIQALDSFCNWCVTSKRLLANPLLGLERLNTEIDIRRKRRALTGDEIARLIASARGSNVEVQRFDGEQRARIYLLAYMTGLRKSELASLSPTSFDLEAHQPIVTVEAACSKHRRKDVLPLHPELVARLREWLPGVGPTEKLFPKLGRKSTSEMVRRDLKRVGIPYRTETGVADFHAAGRHTHITELLRNGATLPEAKELARHSDIKMTMRYTHIGIADQARAVANLPTPKLNPKQPAIPSGESTVALHGRCSLGGAEVQAVATTGNAEVTGTRKNPRRSKGFDSARREMSSNDKVPKVGLEPTRPCGHWILSTALVGTVLIALLLTRHVDWLGSRPGRPRSR